MSAAAGSRTQYAPRVFRRHLDELNVSRTRTVIGE
jgi:hypothetical protein